MAWGIRRIVGDAAGGIGAARRQGREETGPRGCASEIGALSQLVTAGALETDPRRDSRSADRRLYRLSKLDRPRAQGPSGASAIDFGRGLKPAKACSSRCLLPGMPLGQAK